MSISWGEETQLRDELAQTKARLAEREQDCKDLVAEVASKRARLAEAERLRGLLRRASVGVGHYHGPFGPCDACDIEAALRATDRENDAHGV